MHELFPSKVRNNTNMKHQPHNPLRVRQKNSETAELGYWSNPEFTGYMTNALKVFVSELKKLGFKSVYALTRPENKRSLGLLERAKGKKVPYEDKGYDKYEL